MPLRAVPLTELFLMPPPEAPLTTGLARELLRVLRATPRALPTRSPTLTASMPLRATTPLWPLTLATAPVTRPPLPEVDTNTDVPVATTPWQPEDRVLLPLVASEMDATVEFQATVARRPTVPMTDNTETRPPVALPWLAVLSAVVARELLALPSTLSVTLTTLASEDRDSAALSPTVAPTSDVPLDSVQVATTTVMLTPVAELLPLAVMPSAALAWLATLACSDALAPLVLVASLLADTTKVQLEFLATRVRPMAATRATVVLKATVVLPLSAVVPDVPLPSRAVLATVPVSLASLAAAVASVATALASVSDALADSASAEDVDSAAVASADTVVASVASADTAAVPDTVVASAATAVVPATVAASAATAATATDIEQ